MKNILITGGNGFIGRYVCEEVVRRGSKPIVLDRHRWREEAALPDTPYHVYFGDIKDATLVTDAVAHVDGVIHLAGVLGTQETIENPVPAAETNVLGGLNVIQACAQYDVPLINIAVGNFWMNNTYSISKNTVERFVKMVAKYRGKAMGSVRALNAYGPRQVPTAPYGPSRVRKIMPSFICRALDGLPIEIYGEGDQVMDMIYVTDVANILVSALMYLEQEGSIEDMEAGTGRDTCVNEIAAIVQANLAAIGVPSTIEHLPMRPGEDPHSLVLGDPDTLAQIGIGRDDLVMLEAGSRTTIDYYAERMGTMA